MSADLSQVVDRLVRAVPRAAQARVAVDGIGASGKTRFAAALAAHAARRPVVVLHADDFFNPPSVRHARGGTPRRGSGSTPTTWPR